MSRILMVAAESTPFVKTGGLADVMEALPAALKQRGEDVAVVLPRYGTMAPAETHRIRPSFPVWLGNHYYRAALDVAYVHDVPYYLLDCPELYDRDQIYGTYKDNHIRFAVLARAALEIVRGVFRPEVIHCHDWHTGLLPAYLAGTLAGDPTFYGARTLYTIHNLGYHLDFEKKQIGELALDEAQFTPAGLEFWGKGNFMKAGLRYSYHLSTVSPTYAREIQTPDYGFGFDGLLAERADSLTGILNGVDYRAWSPEADPHLAANYSVDDLQGKQVSKRALLDEMGLAGGPLDRPLLAMISRFSPQKGFDLLEEIATDLMAEDLYLIILGTGDKHYEEMLQELARNYPDRCAVRVGFDNPLAHRIEAGADIFLMPSHYEPCGLNQMYSLRYGTVPVVRATGGLDDTIDQSTGFTFGPYEAAAFLEAVRAALRTYRDSERWGELMRTGMRRDFSWDASAARYSELYRQIRV